MDNRFDKIIDEIKKGKMFLVVSHVNPEGDAVGTLLAMGLALKELGRDVKMFLQDNVPQVFKFLPGAEDIVHTIGDGESFDVTIVVDCAQRDRLGEDFKKVKKFGKIINIDHHVTNSTFGDINIIMPQASAAGEIVYDLLKAMDLKITKDIALNIYSAILTDTGSFRYSCTTPHAFEAAGEMIRCGVDPWYVSQMVYESYPAKRFKLLGMVLDTVELSYDGKIAALLVTLDMLKKSSADKEDTDGFVNFARSISGVEVAVLFRESGLNEYKISFRSRGNVDVAEIGLIFGGGGHKNAAGCNVKGTLEEVKRKVLDATMEKIKGQGARH